MSSLDPLLGSSKSSFFAERVEGVLLCTTLGNRTALTRHG